MSEVVIENLIKKYGNFTAVKNLDLNIQDGEFLTLLGPSGCGKTTTLRCIAGLERQSSGDIVIGDRVVNALSPGDRDIAMVFQFYALYPHLSAYDNIAFPLRAQKVEPAEVDKRVRQAAGVLRIDHLLNRRPDRLGSGEQQRVALGRAMVRRPQVFLMDEPLTNLDAKLRGDMRTELKGLQRELATTMVYVTHDQTEALSMAHRIAVMNLGVLQQVGTPLEVYDHPATLFVAGFIGSPPMNMIKSTLAEGALVSAGGFRYQLTPAMNEQIRAKATGAALIFGVRPEDAQIISGEGGDLRATVYSRQPLGDEVIYDLKVGDELLRAKAPTTMRLANGTPVGITLDASRTHVFDEATEAVIY